MTHGMALSFRTGGESQGPAAPAARDVTFLDLPGFNLLEWGHGPPDCGPPEAFLLGRFFAALVLPSSSWPNAGLRDAAPGRERSAAN